MTNVTLTTNNYLGKNLSVEFTTLAVENINETGIDWTDDYHDLRTGQITSEALLEKCLDGADADRVTGWEEYVAALESAVSAPEEIAPESDDSGMVTIEEMPDHHRGSHRAAGNWGRYPANGATRRQVSADEAEAIIESDPDGYAHIVE